MSKYCTYDPSTKVWSGRKYTPIYNTNTNIGYLILQRLIQSPNQVFQISDDTGVKLTNFDIYERSVKFADFFSKSIGLKQGDVVGLIASNTENLVPILLACFILGLAVNPLATVMDENDICYMWTKTKPKLIFSDPKIVEIVKSAVAKMKLDAKILTMVEKIDEFPVAEEILEVDMDIEDFEFPDLPDISSTIALILCSSGTTNAPKGICKTHKQLITQCLSTYWQNYKSQDVYFISASSYWITYSMYLIVGALYGTKVVFTAQPVTPELWMDIIERNQVTRVVTSPRFAALVLKSKNLRPLPSLVTIAIGGTAFSEKLVNDLKSIIPNGTVVCTYGCTEGDALSTTGKEGPKGASSGYPFKNVKIKIVDESGNSLGPNSVGEICYKTPLPFAAYIGDPQSYKDTFDKEGFTKSGDVGYIDEEGYVYVLDRIKNMIETVDGKAGSYTITPNQIEEVINEIDGVIQSCVVGVFDESIFYDKIYAFVIKDRSVVELTEEFVMNYVNGKVIAPKKITGGVIFVDEYPTTPNGKILNRKLKEIAKEIHEKKGTD